ncbi:MAG: hypothetical protein AAFR90_14145 [Pseudomonadota bacterium]
MSASDDKKYVKLQRSNNDPNPLLRHVASLRHLPRNQKIYPTMIPLHIETAFGTQRVPEGYEFKLQRCFIDVHFKNCKLSGDLPKYRRSLTDDDCNTIIEQLKKETARIAGDAEIKLAVSVYEFFKFLIKGNISKENEDEHIVKTILNKKMKIVGVFGGDRWLVGDEKYGDPLNYGFLSGDYLSYPPDADAGEDIPADRKNTLCAVSLDTNKSEMNIIVELRADTRDFSVVSLPEDNDKRDSLNQQIIEQVSILKENRKRQLQAGIECEDHEILLDRCTLIGKLIDE